MGSYIVPPLPEPTEVVNGAGVTHYYWKAANGSGVQVHARIVAPGHGSGQSEVVTALQCPHRCREVLAEIPGPVTPGAIRSLLETYVPDVAVPSVKLPVPVVPLPS
jgi:hypothetical protein